MKYMVVINTENDLLSINIDADRYVVDENETLNFVKKGDRVSTFSRGNWIYVRRTDE